MGKEADSVRNWGRLKKALYRSQRVGKIAARSRFSPLDFFILIIGFFPLQWSCDGAELQIKVFLRSSSSLLSNRQQVFSSPLISGIELAKLVGDLVVLPLFAQICK
ncbi:hypothetical protein Ancab_026111 [Ancistrocladus abbreviatus]